MSLGVTKLVEPGKALAEEEVPMATLRAAPTRHRHTEQISGILTDPILT